MKILQVNCVYNTGSTGKIVHDIHMGLQAKNIASIVCYGRGMKVTEENTYKTCGEWYSKLNNLWSRISGIMYGGCFFSTKTLISIIQKERPDIVHLQCINGYFVNIYKIVSWLKENHIPTILTLHAEFMYTGGCGYALECQQWKSRHGCGYLECPRWRTETHSLFADRTRKMWQKMKEAFTGFDNGLIIISVSPWLMKRAQESPILRGKKHFTILNGLDTTVFSPHFDSALRKKYCPNGEKIIFHPTAYFRPEKEHNKGGYYVLKLAEILKHKNIKILVAGTYSDNIPSQENVIFLGKILDQETLAKYYSIADITVLTSKNETFSMVTAESLCCGTPVVGFQAGGPESIAISTDCEFVEYGNLDDLVNAIFKYLYKSKSNELPNLAIKKYNKKNMINEYIKYYKMLLSNQDKENYNK